MTALNEYDNSPSQLGSFYAEYLINCKNNTTYYIIIVIIYYLLFYMQNDYYITCEFKRAK